MDDDDEESGVPPVVHNPYEVPEQVRPGIAIMDQILGLITTGQIVEPKIHNQLAHFITDIQAQADLIHVGQIPLHLGRLARLVTLAGKAEQRLEEYLDSNYPIEPKDLASILKAIYGESNSIIGHLKEAAVKPTISSPDSMMRTVSPTPLADPSTTTTLSIDSRRRVVGLVGQFRARAAALKKAQAVDAEAGAAGDKPSN